MLFFKSCVCLSLQSVDRFVILLPWGLGFVEMCQHNVCVEESLLFTKESRGR